MQKLAVIIPVYNEEGAIADVLASWVSELKRLGIRFSVLVFNDGSKDHTLAILHQKSKAFPEVQVFDRANKGHGPTILEGYRWAAGEGFDWIFQIDGDNEMGPEGFEKLWEHRENYDFLICQRGKRQSPLPRRIISAISYLTVRLFYRGHIKDVNSPYRLMRVSFFKPIFQTIASDTFAPNVILSGAACFCKARIFESVTEFRSRKSGTVSIKKWKLLKAALKSFKQTIQYIKSKKPYLQKTFNV